MADYPRQIVEALLKAPEIVQALQQDPRAFAARFGVGDKELLLLQAGKNLVHDLVNRFCAHSSNQPAQLTANANQFRTECSDASAPCNRTAAAKGSSSVALVAVASLAAVTGMLAALGTVSVVGISANGRSDRRT